MRIETLRAIGFRAHKKTFVAFGPGLNVIHGPNGAGKTNLLEAVHYLSLSKSFLSANDAYVVRKGSPYFEVSGRFAGERRPHLDIRVAFQPGQGKSVHLNGAKIERITELVGSVPVVMVSPADHDIAVGGPDERRRFFDNVLSQSRPVYFSDLLKYRRALRQRNELLYQMRSSAKFQGPNSMLESWNAELASLGAAIVTRREQFVASFRAHLDDVYGDFSDRIEKPNIIYRPSGMDLPEMSEQDRYDLLVRRLTDDVRKETRMGRTLTGPHLDEYTFLLDGMEVRRYASQGQVRSFTLALRFAQHGYLRYLLDEQPILLLDDVFGSLDEQRAGTLIARLSSGAYGQVLVTIASQGAGREPENIFCVPHQSIRIERGNVTDERTIA